MFGDIKIGNCMGEGANLRGLGAIVRGARGPLVISFVFAFFLPPSFAG